MTTSQETPRSAIWRRLMEEWQADAERWGLQNPSYARALKRCRSDVDTALRACAEAPATDKGETHQRCRGHWSEEFRCTLHEGHDGDHQGEMVTYGTEALAPSTDTGVIDGL